MFDFVRRNRIVFTSGSLLLVSLLLLSVGARSRQRIDPLTGVVLEGMRPLQAAVAAAVEAVSSLWGSYIMLIGVREENEVLRSRLLELEHQTIRGLEAEETVRRLNDLLQFRNTFDGETHAARIIGRDPLPWFGTVIIDKGHADGVRKGMAVLSPFGVVGQTIATSAHSARVLLITDHNSGIDAVVQRSRARGIVEGALDGRCIMKYLTRGEDVEIDDHVVTSGLDGIFPKGALLGRVTHVTRGTRGLLQLAEMTPAAPLDRIEEVLVVPADTRLQEAR